MKQKNLIAILISFILFACNFETIRPSGENKIDITPNALSMATPNSSVGILATPVVRVNGVESGDSVSIYTSSGCALPSLKGTAVATGNSVLVTSSALSVGTSTFYANVTRGTQPTSSCSTAVVSYTLQAASKISMARSTYTIDRAGASIGQAVTVVRDAPGTAQSVNLNVDQITTTSSDVTPSVITVNFAANDTAVVVPASSFTTAANVALAGDRFFRVRLSNPTAAATLGTEVDSQVNLLDSILDGKFFFSQSLYTAVEGSAAPITIQRAGTLGSSETVELRFINGTAIGGTHFTATTQVVTFGATDREITVTVPTTANAVAKDSRSFYVELKNPSVGARVRPWSTAKVRILDNDDTTVCDAANNNLGVNNGFGGGDGATDPYRVCSISQFYRIRNHMTSNYRIMADLDLDPSLEVDPASPGTHFSPVTGSFTGQLDGDEHVLKNFRHTQTTYTPDPVALFYQIGQNITASFTNLNLIQSSVVSTVDGDSMSGIIGRVYNVGTIANLHYSGYVKTQGNSSYASGVVNRSNGTLALPMTRTFSHGLIVSSASVAGGVLAGAFDWAVNISLKEAYSVATVIAAEHSGGIVGRANSVGNLVAKMEDLISRGVTISTNNGSTSAGVFAEIAAGSPVLSFKNIESSGIVTGGSRTGGVFGALVIGVPLTTAAVIDHIRSTATVIGAEAGGTIGGVFAYFNNSAAGSVSTVNDVEFSGSISNPQLWNTLGGIIGVMHANASTTFTNLNNTASLSNTNGAGGIAGTVNLTGLHGDTIRFESVTSSGNISSAASNTYNIGGLFGSVDGSPTGAQNTFQLINSSSSAIINAGYQTGGLIGGFGTSDTAGLFGTISNCSFTGEIHSTGSSVGGLVGYLGARGTSGAIDLYVIEKSFVSGSVATTQGRVGGIVGNLGCRHSGSETIRLSSVYNSGAISADGEAGGLIGVFEDENGGASPCSVMLENSYSQGSVFATNATAGGFFGHFNPVYGASVTVNNSYSRSQVTANSNRFGLGRITGSVTINNTYWLQDGSVNVGISPPDGRQKLASDMTGSAIYSSWGNPPWVITGTSYPTLTW